MNRSFQISNGQPEQVQQLPFWAQTVTIDNPGGQWLQVPQANLTVPPYTGGVVAQFPAATTVVRFNTTPPAGQHANGSGNPATLTFETDALPVSSGFEYTALLLANAKSQCFSLTNGTVIGPTTLTFFAQTVTVDNPGDQWIFLPDFNVRVAPWTGGVVVPLAVQTQTVNINTTPPTGQVANGGGSAATVCFTDAALSASSGYSYSGTLVPAFHAKTYSPAAGSHTLDTLTFSAASIRVDNPGGQWLQVTIPGPLVLIVPPFTVGRIIALHTVTTAVDILATAISGQVNTIAGAGAQVLYTDQVLPESPGAPFGQNLSQQPPGVQVIRQTRAAGTNAWSFGVAVPGDAVGAVRRLATLSIALIVNISTTQGQPWDCLVAYGASVGTAIGLWAGNGHTGSGSGGGNTQPFAPPQSISIVFPTDARPQFTGVAGGLMWLEFTSDDTTGFPAIIAVGGFITVPATL